MRRSGLSIIWVIIGIVGGISAGLFYAWQVDPRIVTEVSPAQLSREGRQQFMVVLSLAFARDRDLIRAATRLNDLGEDWQSLADTACELTQSGYASTSTGLIAIRAMVELAASQGYTGCASALIPAVTPSPVRTATDLPAPPTPTAFPTKTPSPEPSPTAIAAPPTASPTPTGDMSIALVETVCDVRIPGQIEVIIRNPDGSGVPGLPVEVIWAEGRQRFFTGLKPERDPGYADFTMTPGQSYQVVIPGRSERTRRLEAGTCTARDGTSARTSYRVVFQRTRSG
jgi:hypothetical protein